MPENVLAAASNMLQQEGEVLARKNGELEATTRKLRVSLRELESDRERLQRRAAQQDELMSAEKDRLEKKASEYAKQVEISPTAGKACRKQRQHSTPYQILRHSNPKNLGLRSIVSCASCDNSFSTGLLSNLTERRLGKYAFTYQLCLNLKDCLPLT